MYHNKYVGQQTTPSAMGIPAMNAVFKLGGKYFYPLSCFNSPRHCLKFGNALKLTFGEACRYL